MAEQATHYSVGVQTDYRESETQTDPYSPAYVIRDGTTPSELLQLAAFTWGMRSPQHNTVPCRVPLVKLVCSADAIKAEVSSSNTPRAKILN